MTAADRPPGCEDYGSGLVGTRGAATRGVGAAGRTEDECRGVGGGEGGCGSQIGSLRVAGLCGFEAPPCWYEQ